MAEVFFTILIFTLFFIFCYLRPCLPPPSSHSTWKLNRLGGGLVRNRADSLIFLKLESPSFYLYFI